MLGLSMQILGFPARRKFVSVWCHAHYKTHKPPKNIAPTVWILETNF